MAPGKQNHALARWDGEYIMIRTHEDGESSFTLSSAQQLLDELTQLLPAAKKNKREKLRNEAARIAREIALLGEDN